MESLLSYTALVMQPNSDPDPITGGTIPDIAKQFYSGVLRVLLVLHHDFAEFLADNHFRLCNVIPAHLTQLRNLVLSAFPSSLFELPDPFTTGLKVDRLEEVRRSPHIAGDYLLPLANGGAKELVDTALQGEKVKEQAAKLAEIISSPSDPCDAASTDDSDIPLLHSLILYLATSALTPKPMPQLQLPSPAFTPTSPQATLLTALASQLPPPAQSHLLTAILNQLRYPNAHTHYFSHALLHLYSTEAGEGGEGGTSSSGAKPTVAEEQPPLEQQQQPSIREMVARQLLERLIVHRPHPWGTIVVLLELMKNPAYGFWGVGFVKDVPEVSLSCRVLDFGFVRGMGVYVIAADD